MRQNEEFGVEKESRKGNKVLISKKQLLAIIPLCERTIYNFEKLGKFPRRIALSSRKSCGIWPKLRHGLIPVGNPAQHPAPERGPELWQLTCEQRSRISRHR